MTGLGAGRDEEAGAELVDLAGERKRRGGAYRIPCRKCGRPVYEHASRCTHCGIWFDGEAYEFSERVSLQGRSWRGASMALFVLLIFVLLFVVALFLGG